MSKAKRKSESWCPIKLGKHTLFLRQDGTVYGHTEAYGVEVLSPVRKEELAEMFGVKCEEGIEDIVKANGPPDVKYKVPTSVLVGWAQRLLLFPGESLIVYGKHKKKDEWLGVVPEQEVSGASVDVDDFGKAAALLMKKGFQRVGTLHTHPGGMTGCSGTDTGELWDKFGGIHIIVTQTGIASYYFSNREKTWDLNRIVNSTWKHKKLWCKKSKVKDKDIKQPANMITENDDDDIDSVVTEKTFYTTTKVTRQQNTSYLWQEPAKGYGKRNKGGTVMYTKCYFGDWKAGFGYSYIEQPVGTRVTIDYLEYYAGYYDAKQNYYLAGRKKGKIITTKIENKKDKVTFSALSTRIVVEPKMFSQIFQDSFVELVDVFDAAATAIENAIAIHYAAKYGYTEAEKKFLMDTSFLLSKISCCIWDDNMKEALRLNGFLIPTDWKKGDKKWQQK